MTLEENPVAENDQFLSDLSRSEVKRKLDLVEEIETQIEAIKGRLENNIGSFLQAECKMEFANMAVFEDGLVAEQNFETTCFHLVQKMAEPSAFFQISKASSRRLLSAALTGSVAEAEEPVSLSAGETRLLKVFFDLLAAEYLRVMEPGSGTDKQATSRLVDAEELTEIIEDADWVCFYFSLEFAGQKEAFSLILPLAMINGENRDFGMFGGGEEVDATTLWRNALFDHIENLKMPLIVELGSAEIPLSTINRMQCGQRFELEIDPRKLEISNDYGQPLLYGSLGVTGNRLGITIKEKAQ